MKTYIGIDNGSTGSIGIIDHTGKKDFFNIPTFVEQNYTKTKQNITRIDFKEFNNILHEIKSIRCFNYECLALLERPMVNPKRFHATTSALRALEATLIALELNHIAFQYLDSKQWQKQMLPQGIKGSDEQKKASLDMGIRLFPEFKNEIIEHKDADGILIAEWARRNNL
jgi:hypothetical protein